MIVTIAELILLIYAIYRYNKGDFCKPLVIFSIFATNCYLLNVGHAALKHFDIGILLLVICSLLGCKKYPHFFSVKNQSGAKLVILYLGFIVVEFVYSVLFSVDSIGGIITVLRESTGFLAFFVFRKIPYCQMEKAIKIIFKLFLISSIAFLFQFITHLQLTNSYVAEGSADYRMQMTPPYLSIILLYLVLFGQRCKHRLLYICLILGILIIAQNRTPIVSFFMQVCIFLLIGSHFKHKTVLVILMLVIAPVLSSVFEKRETTSQDYSFQEVDVLSYLKSKDFVDLSHQSTFFWRIAHLAERADYLIEHPQYLLLGVGAIDEKSDNNKFTFDIGTARHLDNGEIYYYQLRSNDILWSPILIRFGLIGLVIHLFFILKAMLLFFKERSHPLLMIAFLCFCGGLIGSLSSGGFFSFSAQLTLSFFLIALDRCRKGYLIPFDNHLITKKIYIYDT